MIFAYKKWPWILQNRPDFCKNSKRTTYLQLSSFDDHFSQPRQFLTGASPTHVESVTKDSIPTFDPGPIKADQTQCRDLVETDGGSHFHILTFFKGFSKTIFFRPKIEKFENPTCIELSIRRSAEWTKSRKSFCRTNSPHSLFAILVWFFHFWII